MAEYQIPKLVRRGEAQAARDAALRRGVERLRGDVTVIGESSPEPLLKGAYLLLASVLDALLRAGEETGDGK